MNLESTTVTEISHTKPSPEVSATYPYGAATLMLGTTGSGKTSIRPHEMQVTPPKGSASGMHDSTNENN